MTTYLVTGGTGFLGRHLVERLLSRDDAEVLVVVRRQSLAKLDAAAASWPANGRLEPVVGDITEPLLGLSAADRDRLRGNVDHVVHLAAVYDMTADEEANDRSNIGGTREALALAADLQAGLFHHVSSVAVAGEHEGVFTEDMFDEGQTLPSPYHATKFEAEQLVREQDAVPWRVYRPAIIVGHSQTGAMDKLDGPYYFFPALARLAQLPSWLPLVGPDLGDTNIVPVDFVAEAMDAADAQARSRRAGVSSRVARAAATPRCGQRVPAGGGRPDRLRARRPSTRRSCRIRPPNGDPPSWCDARLARRPRPACCAAGGAAARDVQAGLRRDADAARGPPDARSRGSDSACRPAPARDIRRRPG